MTTKYRPPDPFPDEILPYSYPSDASVPRPRLSPYLERLLYNELDDRTMKNSHAWLVEFRLRRCGVLPAEDVARHHIFFNSLVLAGKIKFDTVVLLPDIMCSFLEDLFRETDAKDLKARWGQDYGLIRNYYDFLQYRVRMRDFVFKQHNMNAYEVSPECRTLLGLLAPVSVPCPPELALNTAARQPAYVIPFTLDLARAV